MYYWLLYYASTVLYILPYESSYYCTEQIVCRIRYKQRVSRQYDFSYVPQDFASSETFLNRYYTQMASHQYAFSSA